MILTVTSGFVEIPLKCRNPGNLDLLSQYLYGDWEAPKVMKYLGVVEKRLSSNILTFDNARFLDGTRWYRVSTSC